MERKEKALKNSKKEVEQEKSIKSPSKTVRFKKSQEILAQDQKVLDRKTLKNLRNMRIKGVSLKNFSPSFKESREGRNRKINVKK